MRPLNDHPTNERFTIDSSAQRTLRAAHLLQEALALLGVDSVSPVVPLATHAADRLLRLPEVEHLTGLRRSAIYEQMQRGVFPRSVKAGRRAAAWSERSVQEWIVDRLDGLAT